MAKKAANREFVWWQCSDCGELNYRTSVHIKGGVPDGIKKGLNKFCARERKHTLHKIKRK